ncbi:unnamed protein product [Callosobruchus maculatus]|uniref:Odorant receptor n=1 Tax=Callosobruchus maculatus TaxID=64391 RepID=A0A653C0J2_CALMS|nr:unnamed protein product [Callosobruchus maculatus]
MLDDRKSNTFAYFQVLLYLICLYVQRPKVQLLIEYMKQHFWDPATYSVPELKISYKETMKRLRAKYYGYIVIMLVCASAFCYGRIALDGRHVPENMTFKSYIPPGVNFWALFAWQHIQATGTINILTSMDFCICSIVSLTTLQFRLLRYEVETLFDGFENDQNGSNEFKNKFRKCNGHHNFLLSFTTMVVNTFSMLMFIYMGVIVIILCIETYLLFCM